MSLLCAAWVLRLWRADLTVPLRYAPVDDTKFYLMLVKGIIEHGWYLSNPSLGAPFGQHLYDYPQGADNLNLLIIRGLAVFSSDPALVVNLFLLTTFALTTVTCHLVLRALGVGAAAAGVTSVLFSLLAYHFFRGESHLLLSAYYSVPLTAYLFLELLAGALLFSRRAPPRRWPPAWASPRSLATIGMCLVIGSDNLYYATFALVLIAAATLIALVLRRRRCVRDGLLVVALVVGTLAANLAPSLIYRAEHGANPEVERSAAADESSNEALALRLTNLVLPAPGSRIGALRRITARYDNAIAPGYCEACYASLGTVGTVGFGWLALCGLGTLLGAGWARRRRLLAHASAGAAIALAVGSVGGLGALLELFVTPDIRAWNRISVVIAFLSLLAAGLLLDSLVTGLNGRRWGSALGRALLAAVLVFGVYGQTSDAYIPAYAATARQWRSDSVFVAEIEARLPRGASVFQLPYVPFPEGYPQTPVGGPLATYATKYEPLRGYLHSSTLRWSYGAMKGRPADWAAQLAGQPLSLVTAAVAAAGFEGVWVDPAAFDPAKANQVHSALRSLLGVQPLVSPDRDLWFFDLRPYLARLERTHTPAQLTALREATLYPLSTACVAGGLKLVNPSTFPRPATLTVRLSDRVLSRALVLDPGSTIVTLSDLGAAPMTQVLYATLTGAADLPFAHPGQGPASTVIAGLTGPPCLR